MSDGNSDVPQHIVSVALGPGLPALVPAEEYEACPVTQTLQMLGDKWTLLVMMMLAERPHRYNELRRRVEGISQRMLTRILRVLEDEGIVTRTVFPTVPPGVEYALSDRGRELLVPLAGLADWVVRGTAA
ncbi:helix-turn-helix transcriptional regulator [Nocardioides sp. KC13]|uniref:Helix-turn-helix transcriptional regulator n=1 Tax=Nocardioides turkmenicus TaxID=2711220 RepID=A0A6M1R692_9ACTN|nr:helix-turn-helix domain-containing protein [Nocardioides sp. KC13]NGN94201.1 helix-turn-helix transcriptional regulator [Nocardioides sp. KC13]